MTIIDNLGPNEWSRRAELVFAARHSNGCDAAALTGRWVLPANDEAAESYCVAKHGSAAA